MLLFLSQKLFLFVANISWVISPFRVIFVNDVPSKVDSSAIFAI